jgi:Fe-S-cluster containining protein
MQHQNVIFPDTITFHCKGCGGCCKNQPPDINPKEQQRIDQAGYTNYMENPADPNNRNLRRKSDGSCIFLTKENTCQIHQIKPSICRLEPFIITDFDYQKNLIYLDLNPRAIKECKGLAHENMFSYEEIAAASQTIVNDLQEIISKSTGFSLTDRRLGALVRDFLIS